MQENTWQLQEAKAKFSEFVRAAERYPQTVTVHGKGWVIMMSVAMFRMMATGYARENPDMKQPVSTGQTSQNQEEKG